LLISSQGTSVSRRRGFYYDCCCVRGEGLSLDSGREGPGSRDREGPLPSTFGDPRSVQVTTLPRTPRISVVIPNYNYGRYIASAIRSVLDQGYPDLELIVVDGASTDGSVDIIERFRPVLAAVIVEKDTGQANAINKGLAIASGEIFNWLNSDDVLLPGALAAVAEGMQGRDCLAGACVHTDEHLAPIRRLVQQGLTARRLIRRSIGTIFQQPAFWVRRASLLAIGGLDEDLHFAFDLEMAIRYLARFPRVRYSARDLALFRHHGSSKTEASPGDFGREEEALLARLASAEDFPLRTTAAHWLERRRWWARLAALTDDPTLSRAATLRRIAREAIADPGARLGRATFRAMLRCALPRPKRTV